MKELEKLVGGDRRSIGRVDEVVADVMNNPSLFGIVFDGMLSDDPLLRMRCADAAEKITEKQPGFLQPYKEKLIKEVAKIEQPEVRWHVAQMIPRLEVDQEERACLPHRRNNADLLQHTQVIEVVPLFGNLAISNAQDAYARSCHLLTGGRDAH